MTLEEDEHVGVPALRRLRQLGQDQRDLSAPHPHAGHLEGLSELVPRLPKKHHLHIREASAVQFRRFGARVHTLPAPLFQNHIDIYHPPSLVEKARLTQRVKSADYAVPRRNAAPMKHEDSQTQATEPKRIKKMWMQRDTEHEYDARERDRESTRENMWNVAFLAQLAR